MGTFNRSGVVTDVVGDDFMHSERLLSAKQVHPRLAAPSGASRMVIEQRGLSSVTNLDPGIRIGVFDFVTGPPGGGRARGWMAVFTNSDARGGAGRRREARVDLFGTQEPL